jgi:hypothetical protein
MIDNVTTRIDCHVTGATKSKNGEDVVLFVSCINAPTNKSYFNGEAMSIFIPILLYRDIKKYFNSITPKDSKIIITVLCFRISKSSTTNNRFVASKNIISLKYENKIFTHARQHPLNMDI